MRCFVALWPDAEVRRELDALIDALASVVPGGRRMRAGNLHVTLAFIGTLPAAHATEIAQEIAQIEGAAFPAQPWVIDRVGVFARTRVLWAGGAACDAMDHYINAVQSRLKRLGIRFDEESEKRPFVPHVTLLRDIPPQTQPPQHPFRIHWHLRPPRLIESQRVHGGSNYVPVA